MVVGEVSGCIDAEADPLRKVTGFDYKSGYRRWKRIGLVVWSVRTQTCLKKILENNYRCGGFTLIFSRCVTELSALPETTFLQFGWPQVHTND